MASETQIQPGPPPPVSRGRQWFALWGAAVAWLVLGTSSIVITWQACLYHEEHGGASSHPGLLAVNMVIYFALIAISAWAGILAYRAWRKRAGKEKFIDAEAEDRHEYLALVGVLVTFIMGIGTIWMGLPLWLISLCARTR